MTEILQSSSQFPSSSSTITCVSPTDNDGLHQETYLNSDTLISSPSSYPVALYREHTEGVQVGGGCGNGRQRKRGEREEGDQLSLLAVLVTVFRKYWVACRSERVEEFSTFSAAATTMEIGCPTNVRHVAHVTFDRFNGFLGLPAEFEPEVPRRPPSASASIFGVSTESMQLSFDSRGNSVPTILLMMQRRLYVQGGLQTEGIFRINAENGQEEYVREQLNRGIVPDNIDVHCLAGLIKAWFRELPRGVLDTLSPEQVMQAQTEDECVELVRQLPPTEAALLDWAINLMADVADLEHLNKMNARNIAMVFAPNMTQMAVPLTALMYAVKVMDFLKILIVRTLKGREDSLADFGPRLNSGPDDDDQRHSSIQSIMEVNEDKEASAATEAFTRSLSCPMLAEPKDEKERFLSSIDNIIPDGKDHLADNCTRSDDSMKGGSEGGDSNGAAKGTLSKYHKIKIGQSSNSVLKNGTKISSKPVVHVIGTIEKSKETSIFSSLNSMAERVEAWL